MNHVEDSAPPRVRYDSPRLAGRRHSIVIPWGPRGMSSSLRLQGFGVRADHPDAVDVDKNKVQILADNVHQTLKGLGSVLRAERHSKELNEGSSQQCWGCLPRPQGSSSSTLVSGPPYPHTGSEILYVGHWVPVWYSDVVKTPVITAEAPSPQSLWYHV